MNHGYESFVISSLAFFRCTDLVFFRSSKRFSYFLCISGKRNCLLISKRILKVLVELLSCANLDIVPYVNGALYSILILPEMRKVANQMVCDFAHFLFVPSMNFMYRGFFVFVLTIRNDWLIICCAFRFKIHALYWLAQLVWYT